MMKSSMKRANIDEGEENSCASGEENDKLVIKY